MKRLLLLGFILFGFTTVYAQRSIEVEGGLGLPGGDLEAFYKNQPYYSISVTNTLSENIDGIFQCGI